jgi:hypothetical protein
MEKTHRKPPKIGCFEEYPSWNFLELSLINNSKSIIHSLLKHPSEQMFLQLSKRTRVTRGQKETPSNLRLQDSRVYGSFIPFLSGTALRRRGQKETPSNTTLKKC